MKRKFDLFAAVILSSIALFGLIVITQSHGSPPPAGATSRVQSVDGGITNQGYVQLTTLTVATGVTAPGGANCAMIQAEGDQIRWRDDGTNPTATVGMFIPSGSGIWYTGDFTKLKFIQQSGGGIINISFYYSG